MMHEIHIKDLQDLDRGAEEFLAAIGDRKLIAFYAPMAAGKTTFTTAVCKRLGVSEDAVSSPTFAIVNEYRTGTGEPMYHFDFYRIERLEEAYDISPRRPSKSISGSIRTIPAPFPGKIKDSSGLPATAPDRWTSGARRRCGRTCSRRR